MKKKRALLIFITIIVVCCIAAAVVSCKATDFTINFVVDGADYAQLSTSGQEVIRMPANPAKDGYTFDGWYWDDGTWQRPFTASSLLNEPLTANMSVYAKFTEIHKHTYSTEWSKDERGHWHVATCEHTCETTQVESHTYDKNFKCKICGYQDTSLHGTEIATEVFDVNGETLYAKTPNSQTVFSFISTIQVANGAIFDVSTDLAGRNVIRTKTVSLDIGDNTYYIFVKNGNDIKLYTVTLRRKPIYTVTFITNGGTTCDSQQVEEDKLATKPTTSKTGYSFVNWDYDFATPITQNTSITAIWTANEYIVTYDVNGGVLSDTQYTATYDSTYTLAVPTREGHTFQGWYIDGAQIVDGYGQSRAKWMYTENKTATAKWSINSYSLTITNSNSNAGTVTGAGTKVYNSEVTVTATEPNLGYEWLGWYDGDELIATEYSYSFIMPSNQVSFTVKYKTREEMSNFNFTSTATICTITGINDKTVTEITIPDYVTSIGFSAFSSCNKLIGIKIGNSVTNIGFYAFRDCGSLICITIPDSVTSIGYGAFGGCNSLERITIPFVGASKDGTENTHFGYIFGASRAYDSNSNTSQNSNSVPASLNTVVITGSSRIDVNSFYNCFNLTNVTIPSSIISMAYSPFSGCSAITIYCEVEGKPDNWNNTWNRTDSSQNSYCPVIWNCKSNKVDENGYMYAIIDGIRYSLKDDIAMVVRQPKDIIIANIPSLVMYDNMNYKVESVDSYAFYECRNLTNVTICDNVVSIGQGAFQYCGHLTSIAIPDTVTTVSSYAFFNCNSLTSVKIGNGITSIGEQAFSGPNKLKTVYYNGTARDWMNVSVNAYLSPLTSEILFYYSETMPTDVGNYWHYSENGDIVEW